MLIFQRKSAAGRAVFRPVRLRVRAAVPTPDTEKSGRNCRKNVQMQEGNPAADALAADLPKGGRHALDTAFARSQMR